MDVPRVEPAILHEGHEHSSAAGWEWAVLAGVAVVVLVLVAYGLKRHTR